ncbi:hypothetical protein [Nevskia sp.]|uniref:hypothetical protein n=1 Tax=Nevskia sp. TaxID=1929292 RepID=UPI0025F9B2C1|nr:hypothetical protein [Nevskia sp.]
MKQPLFLALAALLLPLSASAFEIKARSNSAVLDEATITEMVKAVAAEVGHTIPQDPNIKVSVYTRAVVSEIEGKMIYFHRVQLTKAFVGQAPYPTAAWLPVKTNERYGIDAPETLKASFETTLRDFFQQMKLIDPKIGFR